MSVARQQSAVDETTSSLSPDLEEDYHRVVNDPNKQLYYKSIGKTPDKIRADFLKIQKARQEKEALAEQWLTLSDEEFIEGMLRLSPQGRSKLTFLLSTKEGKRVLHRICLLQQQPQLEQIFLQQQ